MTLVTLNVPLIAQGVSPVAFSAVPPADLLAGIRSVCELNRGELFADSSLRDRVRGCLSVECSISAARMREL